MAQLKPSAPLCERDRHSIIAWRGTAPVDIEQFLGDVAWLAAQLPGQDYAINLCADRYAFLVGFCAVISSGQANLLPVNQLDKSISAVREQYSDSYLISDQHGHQPDVLVDLPRPGSHGKTDVPVPVVPLEQLCAIAFTSGSTGVPAANPKYWHTLTTGAHLNAGVILAGGVSHYNAVATVPPQHMWGLETSIMLPLVAPLAISSKTPFFPLDVAETLAALPEPRLLVSTPVHLASMTRAGLSFAEVARTLSATAPLSTDLARAVESLFGGEMIEIYGCSEAGIFASRETTREEEWCLSDSFSLDIAPCVAQLSAPHLPASVELQDRLQVAGPRRFKWLGRSGDLVNIAGKRGSLADLNIKLQGIDGIEDGIIFMPGASSERPAALVVAPGLSVREIRAELGKLVDPVFLPRPLLCVDSLPRNAAGKLPLDTVRELFARHSTAAAS